VISLKFPASCLTGVRNLHIMLLYLIPCQRAGGPTERTHGLCDQQDLGREGFAPRNTGLGKAAGSPFHFFSETPLTASPHAP
jgi:hypothetical protein